MNINLDFRYPSIKNYLIFDDLKLEVLNKYLGNSSNVISFRNRRFNFFATLYALFFFFKSELKVEYICFFLRFTKKKTIISFNYNRLILYRIKKYYPKVKIIIIQNGLSNDFFIDRLKKSKFKLTCDYFFCITELEKKIFEKNISSKFIVIGSFLNNFFFKEEKKKKELLLISQFRDKKDILEFQKYYYLTLKFLIPNLIKLTLKKNITLSILGSSYSYQKEINYYKKLYSRLLK